MEESWRRTLTATTTTTTGSGFIPRCHSTDDHHGRNQTNSAARRRRRRRSSHLQCSSNIDDDGDDDPVNIHHMQHVAVPDELDFRDVFEGPPRSSTVLLRRLFAADGMCSSSSSSNFYDEIFCPTALRTDHRPSMRRSRNSSNNYSVSRGSGIKIGRKLPGFSIPSSSSSSTHEEKPILSSSERLMEEGFYDDIFGCSNRRTSWLTTTRSSSSSKSNYSRSKQKAAHSGSSTASVPSSEDTILIPSNIDMISVMPPPPPPTTTTTTRHRSHHQHEKVEDEHEDAILSSFASKLRPITIPIRRSRGYKYDSSPPSTVLSGTEAQVQESSSQRSLITINPLSTTFLDLSSSSLARPLPTPSPDVKRIFSFDASSIRPLFTDKKQVTVQVQEEDGDVNSEEDDQSENDSDIESEGSFVVKEIEYGSRGETEGAAAVDEAIAWAKDKFWNGRPPTDTSDT